MVVIAFMSTLDQLMFTITGCINHKRQYTAIKRGIKN